MADFKAATTVAGSVIWHQGNFPLMPAGDDILYKTFKLYTEYNKPKAADNDFVSKANGGTYLKKVIFNEGVAVKTADDQTNGIFSGGGDAATFDQTNMDIVSWYGIGFKSSQGTGERTVVIDTRTGNISSKGVIEASQFRATTLAPLNNYDLTRKDYVDSQINTVNANANSRVLRSGDTMTGALTAPNFFSQNPASQPSHVPRFDQIVIKDSVQDFGYY